MRQNLNVTKMTKKISILMLIALSFLTYSCQKDSGIENSAVDKSKELTKTELELKDKMNQAAMILAEFSSDNEVNEEIQNLIDLNLYKDDYIEFRDLFQPESNDNLKSASVSKFANRFRQVANSDKFKSAKVDNFDLESYLIDNHLSLYVPYPLSDYPEGNRVPTISFHPLDNDTVNIGYSVTTNKYTNQIKLVGEVTENYSLGTPVYIITPIAAEQKESGDGLGSGSGGSGSGSGSGSNSNYGTGDHTLVKLMHMQVKKQYDGFFKGGSEIHILSAGSTVVDAKNHIAGVVTHLSTVVSVSRRNIRQENHVYLNLTMDPDWGKAELVNYFAAVELDDESETTLNMSVSYKIGGVPVSATQSKKIVDGHDFIAEIELPRDFFMLSQANPSLIDYGTHEGNVRRPLGTDVVYTTKVIDY